MRGCTVRIFGAKALIIIYTKQISTNSLHWTRTEHNLCNLKEELEEFKELFLHEARDCGRPGPEISSYTNQRFLKYRMWLLLPSRLYALPHAGLIFPENHPSILDFSWPSAQVFFIYFIDGRSDSFKEDLRQQWSWNNQRWLCAQTTQIFWVRIVFLSCGSAASNVLLINCKL